jgi:PAS domain-containing protein
MRLWRRSRGESVDHFETLRLTKDGRLIDVAITVSPIKDSSDTVIGVSKMARDITGRRRSEQALRDSDEKFHQLADNITEVFWITSPDLGIMHYVSAGYEVIWGRSEASLYANPHQWRNRRGRRSRASPRYFRRTDGR